LPFRSSLPGPITNIRNSLIRPAKPKTHTDRKQSPLISALPQMANCDAADLITTSWILNKPIPRILTGTITERINRIITYLESWTADLVDQGDTSGPASIFTIFVSLVKRPLPSFSTGVGGCSFVLLFSVELFKGSRGPRGINFQVIRRWKDPFIYSNPLHTLVCVGICGGLWILTI